MIFWEGKKFGKFWYFYLIFSTPNKRLNCVHCLGNEEKPGKISRLVDFNLGEILMIFLLEINVQVFDI